MKKLILGLAVIFLGSMFFTSCSSDSAVMSQFSKRKYMKNFKKSKVKQKENIDEYQYALAVNGSNAKVATVEEVTMEEIVATDDATMVAFKSENKVATAKVKGNVEVAESFSTEKTIKTDMTEAVAFHNTKDNNSKISSNNAQVNSIVLIILGILLPPLAVYLYEDSITNNFWLDLVLTLLFWIPGVIYAFLVMFAGISI